MPDPNANRAAAQERVVPTADQRGQEWTAAELEFFEVFASADAEDLARALGRTVYGVNNVRDRLREGLPVGGGTTTPAAKLKALQAQPWAPDDPRWG